MGGKEGVLAGKGSRGYASALAGDQPYLCILPSGSCQLGEGVLLLSHPLKPYQCSCLVCCFEWEEGQQVPWYWPIAMLGIVLLLAAESVCWVAVLISCLVSLDAGIFGSLRG